MTDYKSNLPLHNGFYILMFLYHNSLKFTKNYYLSDSKEFIKRLIVLVYQITYQVT